MKFLRQPNQLNLILLAVCCLISLGIWFFSPLLIMPLANSEKRLSLITLLFLAWLFKVYCLDTPEQAIPPLSLDNLKKLYAMRSRFKGAIQFLQKTLINKRGNDVSLFQLPWYLLIGPQHTGKTTLLANSTINYVLAKQFKDSPSIGASENCDWWVTRDLVMIDIPSTYIFPKKIGNTYTRSFNRFLWNRFVDLTKKYRKKNGLNGVVLAISFADLDSLEDKSMKEAFFIPLKRCILQIRQHFGTAIPFYFALTQCDRIPGFIEFFGDYNNEELMQSWGITIPPLRNNESLTNTFLSRFNALIKRLNKQLIWRLHQEKNSDAKPLIKDFPLQIEKLKKNIAALIKEIQLPDLNLQGVYLTSAAQPTEQADPDLLPTTQHAMLPAAAFSDRPFFIKQFILQALLHSFEQPAPNKQKQQKWTLLATYTSAIAILAVAAVFLGMDFQRSLQQTYLLQNLLTEYQTSLQQSNDKDQLIKALPLLNTLQNTANKTSYTIYNRIYHIYSERSQQSVTQLYQQALHTILMPTVARLLENDLNASKNTSELYTALRAYLLLGNSTETNAAEFIANRLPIQEKERDEILQHLQAALLISPRTPLNIDAISQARQHLASVPPTELAFIVLKNNDSRVDAKISWNDFIENSLLTTSGLSNNITQLFTLQYFQTVLSTDIPLAAHQALHGNAILGDDFNRTAIISEAALKQAIETRYIAAYANTWENLFTHIQLMMPRDLTQTDALLSNLVSNHSHLLNLLNTIQQNTAFEPILSTSPTLRALDAMLRDPQQQNPLMQALAGLSTLHNELTIILQATHPDEAAFLVAKMRAQNSGQDLIDQLKLIAEQNPAPIKNIINSLADHSWHLVILQASQHIQLQWKTHVAPYYQALVNRYPIKPDAIEDADLQQFSTFFSPQGVLTRFYQQFVKPFVNESEKEWQWHSLNQQQLALPKKFLPQLQYALQLQRAVFANGDAKLFVPFSLQAISIDNAIKTLNLNINGQLSSYSAATPNATRMLSWPGNTVTHTTTLSTTSVTDETNTETFSGDWAWFHLVNKTMQFTVSNKEMVIALNANGHSAKYKLLTQTTLNPFLASNWEKMQLPLELTS